MTDTCYRPFDVANKVVECNGNVTPECGSGYCVEHCRIHCGALANGSRACTVALAPAKPHPTPAPSGDDDELSNSDWRVFRALQKEVKKLHMSAGVFVLITVAAFAVTVITFIASLPPPFVRWSISSPSGLGHSTCTLLTPGDARAGMMLCCDSKSPGTLPPHCTMHAEPATLKAHDTEVSIALCEEDEWEVEMLRKACTTDPTFRRLYEDAGR